MKIPATVLMMAAMVFSGSAFAGTTTIDFTQGLGNLVQSGGSGSLDVDENCDAVFTGTPTYYVGSGTSSGEISITMNIVPSTDVGVSENPGLIIFDNDTGDFISPPISIRTGW